MSKIHPGAICKIVNAPKYNGRMVVALHPTPIGDYTLPDGYPACGGCSGAWVVESLDGTFEVSIYSAGRITHTRQTRFPAVHERYLKPYDPGDGADEVNAIAQRKSGREVKA